MKIPNALLGNGFARMEFIQGVIDRCLSSREERTRSYRNLKQWYFYGREQQGDPSENIFGTVNKIWSHLDQVVSFLYSQDTTRFSVEIAKSVSELELLKTPALNEGVNDHWHSSNTDIIFGDALLWSLVYGSMFIKPRWFIDHIAPGTVEPHNIGVWREDVRGLENQPAFVHCYHIPEEQLRYELTIANYAGVESILEQAVFDYKSDPGSLGSSPIAVSTAMPSASGTIDLVGPRMSYVPKQSTPMAAMYELYIFDDEIHDFRVITIAHPGIVVYDRPLERMFISNEPPLVQICPYPLHDYFYGVSLVERLIGLQDMRNTRWDQVQHMMEMQASPPGFAEGQFGAQDEVQAAMDMPNGLVVGDPNSKLTKLETTIPDDLFAEIQYIDSQFDEVDGTTPIMSGKGESGVRSEGHASQLLRVGASRSKRRALIVEDSLEELATLYLRILQKFSKESYRALPADSGDESKGIEFVAAQFTDKFVVKVDAHSNSPLFMQDMTNLAFELFKAKAIDRDELIDMLPVPMKDLMKLKLKKQIQPQEAAAAEKERQLALQTGKVTPMHGKK